MKRYKLINNCVGWAVFFIALVTYCLTVEPSASFWDCPEFVTAAARLEIGHPPGAPFYMLTGNVFSHLTSDPAKEALMINLMSALLSAFTILFLFWTITHLIRRIIVRDEVCVVGGTGPTTVQTLIIMASGVGGALAYAWSDTFWFSAVEAEVYAYSSMFTALVVLLMLKWEEHSHEPRSDRWIVLIFYLTGLSIGVHLLNLLCLPALVLIYTFIRYPKTGYKGAFIALAISFVLIVAVLFGLVPGLVKVAGWFELFFVNYCGLPFNTGVIIYFAVLIPTVLITIWATTKRMRPILNALYTASVGLLGIPFIGKGLVMPLIVGAVLLTILFILLFVKYKGQYLLRKQALNTSMLCMLMLMIGYSTYAVTVVRAVQEPPMSQNSPKDIYTLGTYISREQYGESPLLYGQAYTSQSIGYKKNDFIRHHVNTAHEDSVGRPDAYDIIERSKGLLYPDEMMMLFPRMYSTSKAHQLGYESWMGGVEKRPVTYTVERHGEKVVKEGEMPTQLYNFGYFFSFQVYQMYLRYFLWNFAGRQNDYSARGDGFTGNFVTGFDCIDTFLHGDQDKLPDFLSHNKGRNVYYCIPLILGILGLVWQLRQRKRGMQHFWVVFFLFFMTGLAIVLYINQPPSQPRERDYVYAGSFYAFCIWIGYGIAALSHLPARVVRWCRKEWSHRYDLPVACAICLVALAVPLQMVSQTWDDHDRSGRHLCPDLAYDFMTSFDDKEPPILFTAGDNCTFPLWYIQDTEGYRRDARIINLSYFQTDWYIDQLRQQKWASPGVPIDWNHEEYMSHVGREYFPIRNNQKFMQQLKKDLATKPEVRAKYKGGTDPYELQFVIDNFLRDLSRGYFPTDSLVMTVDKEAVLASGITLPPGVKSIPDKMIFTFKDRPSLWRKEVMMLEILQRNNWKRPLYLSAQFSRREMGGLANYAILEGLVYRVTPFPIGPDAVNTERMFDNMVHKYRYGGISAPDVYLDEVNLDMCYFMRKSFIRLIGALIKEGKLDQAREALQCCKRVLPSDKVTYNGGYKGYDGKRNVLLVAEYWSRVGCDDEAERYLLEIARLKTQLFDYNNTTPAWRRGAFASDYELDWRILTAAYEGLRRLGSPHADEVEADIRRLTSTPCYRLIEKRIADSERQKQEGADGSRSTSGAVDSTKPL